MALSKTHRVTIADFSNEIDGGVSQGVFAPVMTISLSGAGEYGNVMRYLRDIENSGKILVVDRLRFGGGEQLTFELTASIWGIR